MLAGRPYDAWDAQLVAARAEARRLTRLYNATTEGEPERRRELLAELLGSVGEQVWVEPPFYCDYGSNIELGDGTYLICPGVTIGANTTIGAGSVVVEDVPANVLATGNPCRVVRTL